MRVTINMKTIILLLCGGILLSLMYGYLPVMGDRWWDPNSPEYMPLETTVAGEVVYPEESIEFQRGLWYSPYVKIYSIGGDNRVAEISNYLRAYKDLTSHVYTEDVLFIVTEVDLNWDVNGTMVYMDSKDNIFHVGEEATHWIGESLPGAFPLWIESESLPFTEYKFDVSAIPGPIFDMCNETLGMTINGREVYVKILDNTMINKNKRRSIVWKNSGSVSEQNDNPHTV